MHEALHDWQNCSPSSMQLVTPVGGVLFAAHKLGQIAHSAYLAGQTKPKQHPITGGFCQFLKTYCFLLGKVITLHAEAPSCFASQCQLLISPMGMQVRAGRCLLPLQQPVSLCPLMLTAWRHTTARCPASSASCLWMLVSSAGAPSSLNHL